MSRVITEIKSYNDITTRMELQEQVAVRGELPKDYPNFTAMVTVNFGTNEDPFPQEITASFTAKDLDDALTKADPALKEQIKVRGEFLKKQFDEAKEEAMGPRIIT